MQQQQMHEVVESGLHLSANTNIFKCKFKQIQAKSNTRFLFVPVGFWLCSSKVEIFVMFVQPNVIHHT